MADDMASVAGDLRVQISGDRGHTTPLPLHRYDLPQPLIIVPLQRAEFKFIAALRPQRP